MRRSTVLIIGGVILSDQLTKMWAYNQGWVILNPGISFGWLAGVPSSLILGLLTGLVVVLAWWSRRFWTRYTLAGGLFWGGALSNLLDRWWWGGVRDWLPVPGVKIHNNLADYALTVAILIVGYYLIRPSHDHPHPV